MNPTDRARVIRTLVDVQASTEEASCSSDDMSAYTHRLLKHLLSGISPEWQFASIINRQYQNREPNTAPFMMPRMDSPSAAMWSASSAQQIIQENLWQNQEPDITGQRYSFQQPVSQLSVVSRGTVTPTGPGDHLESMLFPSDDDDFW